MANTQDRIKKNRIEKLFLAYFCLMFLINSNYSNAATFKTGKSNSLYVTGKLELGDEKLFSKALQHHANISDIVFENCMGGALQAGFYISQEIKRRKLNTIVSRQCHSSCSYAFLAGQIKKFSDSNGVHMLSLHATTATSGTFEEQEERNRALIRYLSVLTGNKLPEKLKTLIFESRGPSRAVVFIARNYFFRGSEFETRYCNGTEKFNIDKCEKIEYADVATVGIIN